MLTVSGQRQRCEGVGRVQLRVGGSDTVTVDVYVVSYKPLGFDCILGVNGISALGGVLILPSLATRFGSCGEAVCAAVLHIDEPDFTVQYDETDKAWTVIWKWTNDAEPVALRNNVAEYSIPPSARASYEAEVDEWIRKGWLKPYDAKKVGPAKGLIPLMAIVQVNKDKVRPVMDFRELNSHVDAFTAGADVCADKLREWRRLGTNMSIVDLRRAYLQLHVHESLWPFQTVVYHGQRYCLTRLGFGLNVAPSVMKAVLTTVLKQDETVDRATSAYLDDIMVNEDIASVASVESHLLQFGLECKPAERVADGARVLGLYVWGERGELHWKRNNAFGEIADVLTRRSVFSFCGKLIGHLPVCGWLRVATAFIKRRANSLTSTWDERIHDESLRAMLEDTIRRVTLDDPAKGRWDVAGTEATVWVDASSLALGVVVEVDGNVIEDATWLRAEDASHINMAELDAMIKGVNMALEWQMKILHLRTGSLTVFHWISDALSGKARLRTKASSEMLIRRRVGTFKALLDEYGLTVDVKFVRSENNRADVLTRVPHRWLGRLNEGQDRPVCGAVIDTLSAERIMQIHEDTGHHGIRRTLYFSRRVCPAVCRKDVQQVVRACQVCQSIDPAPVKWAKGELNVEEVWSRVGMDVTHVNGRHYLTLIDCGPARFAVWRQLRRQDTASIIEQLEMVFLERGAPPEILTDNDTAFRSEAFMRFAEKWAMRVRFRSAYVASGNGIAERCHRSVKRITARMGCPVAEAVYWYNVTPKDDVDPASAPANKLYSYEIRVRGVDRVLTDELGDVNSPYDVGDDVWVKPPGSRCNTKYQLGTVTKLISPHTVEVGGMPRHVRDLRSAVLLEANPERSPRHELLGDDDEAPGVAPVRVRPGSVVGNDDGVDIGRGEDAAVDVNDDAAVDADDDAAVDADDDAAVDADDDAASLPAARHAAESSNSEDEAPPERPGLRRSTRERRAPNWFMAGQ